MHVRISYTTRPIKFFNVIASTTGEYVSSQSMPNLCEKYCITNLALYLVISLKGLKLLAAKDFTKPFLNLIWKFQNTNMILQNHA